MPLQKDRGVKALYVSDVDGTLTRKDAYPTPETKEILSKLIGEKGLNFTIATGRSLGGAILVKESLGIELPVVCFNGALCFDAENDRVVSMYPIESSLAQKILDLFEEKELPYRYCMFLEERGGIISYRQIPMRFEITKSQNKKTACPYEEVVVKKEIREHSRDGEILYIGHSDKKQRLLRLKDGLDSLEGISYSIHSDPYVEDYWYIDIYSSRAGKDVGARDVQKLISADSLVTFGDNFNDLPLLKNADRSYTVPEADQSIKNIATGVLEDSPDCVARFIQKDFLR